MALSNYFITPKDLRSIIKGYIQTAKRRDALGVIIFLCIGIFLWLTSTLQPYNLGFLLFIFCMFYWRLDSRIPIALALVCLVNIPILLAFKNKIPITEVAAQGLAVWAYYFLAIGVIKQIWEFARGDKTETLQTVESSYLQQGGLEESGARLAVRRTNFIKRNPVVRLRTIASPSVIKNVLASVPKRIRRAPRPKI